MYPYSGAEAARQAAAAIIETVEIKVSFHLAALKADQSSASALLMTLMA